MIRVTMRGAPGAPPTHAPAEVFSAATALEVVRAIQAGSPFTSGLTVSAYVDRVARQVARLGGPDLKVVGSTDDELAESYLEEIDRHGLAAIERS